MTTFTPPVGAGQRRADPESRSPRDRLMRYYDPLPTGETVWKDQLGVWHQGQYPYQGGDVSTVTNDDETTTSDPALGLANAQKVYLGGHTYDITDAEALDLVFSGFGEFINTEPLILDAFKPADLAKFTQWNLTENASAVYSLSVLNEDLICSSTGSQPLQNGARKFFVHSDTSLNSDFDASLILDPPNYGIGGIAQQQGIVLRAQQSGGINTGITINNNIFFVAPNCNIGVWKSNTDGTGFSNRQYSLTGAAFLPFPQQYDVKLEGNIIVVRVYNPWNPVPWDHPTQAATVNLDTQAGDAVAIPTPVGGGIGGVIFAHLGAQANPFAGSRVRGFRCGPRRSLFP